ncbi:hypothetical protein BXZ70DRAFT_1016503 [Cristinia sonorae]|uniref:F-box domain-containing protein n=1 Tax=Cristinia sonorae TaxID=1940300 RepID=A0A8K0US36_9AGAR|nr:hypothetical protein BXZ70DRAFT_1016503 [Cristinia sonorae]
MVSLESLNQDCMEMIFAYLSTRDLSSMALVSHTLLESVTPRLYRSLVFHSEHARKFTKGSSALTASVRRLDIRVVPMYRGAVHTTFLREFLNTVRMAENLNSFTCTQPIILPPALRAMKDHKYIRHIRIHAKLNQEQALALQQLNALDSATLDASTWNVIDMLPNWMCSMSSSLTALTLYSLPDLNDNVFFSTVTALVNLVQLHVVNCGKIQHELVIMLSVHTPKLQSLAFTDLSTSELTAPCQLLHLRHLVIDNRIDAASGLLKASWTFFIKLTREWGCSLTSVVLKPSIRTPIHDSVITDLLDVHETTLQHLMLLNCELSVASMRNIAGQCQRLERLGVSVPYKDIYTVAEAFSRSYSLETLHDLGDITHNHGTRPILTKDNVRVLIDMIPSLKRVVTWDRIWTVRATSTGPCSPPLLWNLIRCTGTQGIR